MQNTNVIKHLDELQDKENLNYDTEKISKEIFKDKNKEQMKTENFKPTADILKSLEHVSPHKKNKIPNKTNNDQTKNKIKSFDVNLSKIQDNISSDLKNQTNVFEEKKKHKMERLRSCKGGI